MTDWVAWPEETDVEDILVEIGRVLYKYTNETFDPRVFLVGLADLLEVALSDPERRPAIQLWPTAMGDLRMGTDHLRRDEPLHRSQEPCARTIRPRCSEAVDRPELLGRRL